MGKPDLSGLLTTTPAPTIVHAHDFHAQRFAPGGQYVWSEPQPPSADTGIMKTAREWYTCGYCGSMHPTDLVGALKAGAHVHWADFKYGWPHKLYVESAPNRYAGELEIRSGVTFCGRPKQEEIDAGKWVKYQDGFDRATGQPTYSYHTPIPPGQPAKETTWGKFYSLHLQDASPEERIVIERAMGLSFVFADGGVEWKRFVEAAD